jgi:hypothetical protein
MIDENVAKPKKEGFDFAGKGPNAVLTKDELAHFDEGMQLKNNSRPADQIDFAKAAKFVIQNMDSLLA